MAPVAAPLSYYMAHYQLDALLDQGASLHAGHLHAHGYRLWTQIWAPAYDRPAQGTAFVVHGYFDHLGLYTHLLKTLLKANWRVVLWDLPGHGLSSGPRASINDFSDYVGCLRELQQQLVSQDLAPGPWVGIGQSTGGAILATDALERREPNCPWQGLVLLAPLVRPWKWQQSRWIHTMLSPFIRTIKRTYRANSTDEAFATFLHHHDPLQDNHIAVAWVTAMRNWMPRLHAYAPVHLPTLILQGEEDLTVDWPYNLELLSTRFPEARIVRHPEARHHLVNEAEPIRTRLFDEMTNFMAELQPDGHPHTTAELHS